jgi:hypothetical protein
MTDLANPVDGGDEIRQRRTPSIVAVEIASVDHVDQSVALRYYGASATRPATQLYCVSVL